MEDLREGAEKKDDYEEIEGVEGPAEEAGGDCVEWALLIFGQNVFPWKSSGSANLLIGDF
jgi:hypothetical protein